MTSRAARSIHQSSKCPRDERSTEREFTDSKSCPAAPAPHSEEQRAKPGCFCLLFSDPAHARTFGFPGVVALQARRECQKLEWHHFRDASRRRLRLSPECKSDIAGLRRRHDRDFLVELIEIELSAVCASQQPADEMAVIDVSVQPLECRAAQIVRRQVFLQPEAATRGRGDRDCQRDYASDRARRGHPLYRIRRPRRSTWACRRGVWRRQRKCTIVRRCSRHQSRLEAGGGPSERRPLRRGLSTLGRL